MTTTPAASTAALETAFYARPVLEVARDLIGCVVEHAGASGTIVETEAYHDSEPACHAFIGATPRTRTLFGPPGRAYVYRSYGIHALLNAVSEPEGVGAAVLIRALEPVHGLSLMRARRTLAARTSHGRALSDTELCSGPGRLTQALAIDISHNDTDLTHGPIHIGARPATHRPPTIVAGRRVGITKAAELSWRFCVSGSPYVSRPRLD